MDNNVIQIKKEAQEIINSNLIEGYWISNGMIYNTDFSACFEDITLNLLYLSVRSSNTLYRAGLRLFSDILKLSPDELKQIKNLGTKSAEEIIKKSHKYLQAAFGTTNLSFKDDKPTKRESNQLRNDFINKRAALKEKVSDISESQLIDGYFISENRIYSIDFCSFTEDVSVVKIGYPSRLKNLLCRMSLFKLSDVLAISPKKAKETKNMGKVMQEELVSKTKEYLASNLIAVNDSENKLIPDGVINDIPFTELTLDLIPFSVRAINALTKSGYQYIYEIAELTYYDYLSIKNLGSKTAKEIYEKVQSFLKEHESVYKIEKSGVLEKSSFALNPSKVITILKLFNSDCESLELPQLLDASKRLLKRAVQKDVVVLYAVKEISDVYRTASVINAINKSIIYLLKKNEIDGLSFSELQSSLPKSMPSNILKERLSELIDKETIRFYERYYVSYPSFSDILVSSDERAAWFVNLRIQGQTLEQVSEAAGGLTRERIRQIESKYMRTLFSRYGRLDEDKYQHLYKTYELPDEFIENYLCFSKQTLYYLEYKYKGFDKKNSLEKALTDSEIPQSIKKQINKYILSQKLLIGNEFVDAKIHLVENALFPFLCKETISVSQFFERYNAFVVDNHHEELRLEGDGLKGRINRYSTDKKLLWTLNQRMRYYDTETIDKDSFIAKLQLDQYHNIEISAKKIYDENIDLMVEYDIRNEYELHNLLKKIIRPSDCPGLQLSRTPIIQFGKTNRQQQVIDLLVQLTPISQYDFADAYSELYGVPQGTVLSNYLPYVKSYITNNRMLIMDVVPLSNKEFERLNSILSEDFYLTDKLQTIFHQSFPLEPMEKINHYTLHQLGFRVCSGYVVRSTYANAQDYFSKLLNENDIIDTNPFHKDLINIQAYRNVLSMYTSNYDLIEFLPKKYIKSSRLEELFGTTKTDIIQFCQQVKKFANSHYFTIQSLKHEGFNDDLFELGFDDYFYSSILYADKEHFAHRKYGGNIIFKVGNQPFVFSDFIEWLLYQEENMSIDIYELIDKLYHTYGVKFNRYEIKAKILQGTSMYYSDITEKLYADYEIYFDEI